MIDICIALTHKLFRLQPQPMGTAKKHRELVPSQGEQKGTAYCNRVQSAPATLTNRDRFVLCTRPQPQRPPNSRQLPDPAFPLRIFLRASWQAGSSIFQSSSIQYQAQTYFVQCCPRRCWNFSGFRRLTRRLH